MADPQDRGTPKAYTVTGKSFHDGRLYRGGEPRWRSKARARKRMADPQDRGAPKAYTVTGKSFHDGRLYRGGEVIMLYDDEVGPHHQEIRPVEAEVPQSQPVPVPVPVKRKWVRKVKPAILPDDHPDMAYINRKAAPAAEAPKSPVQAPVKRGRKAKPTA